MGDNPVVKRVVLIGAESTGKTTLAERLAAHFETVWTPEYLRAFVDQKGTVPDASDTALIAQGHLAQVGAQLPAANRLLFLDTDLISTCVYTRYYFGICPAWLERLSFEHSADLYLFTDIDIPWHPDPGQREGPDVRAALHVLFRQELQRRGVSYTPVSGTPAQRMKIAVAAVEALCRSTTS